MYGFLYYYFRIDLKVIIKYLNMLVKIAFKGMFFFSYNYINCSLVYVIYVFG